MRRSRRSDRLTPGADAPSWFGAQNFKVQRVAPHRSHRFRLRRRLPCQLALAAPAHAEDNAAATMTPATDPQPTPDAFIAAAEEDLFDYGSGQTSRIGSTPPTSPTTPTRWRRGSMRWGPRKSVKYALEAAKYMDVPGSGADTKRKLDILRTGPCPSAPTKPGAATSGPTRSATDLQSQYGKGRGTLDGKEISGSDIEAEMEQS